MRTRAAVVAAMLAAGHLAAADPAPAAAPSPSPEQQVLALVNHYRQLAGVPPVKLDPKLGAGCMAHADYMRRNRGTPAMDGLRAHQEDPKLPGATPAGAECGKTADLFPGVSDLNAAVDGWMAGIYHRRPILAASLQAIGVGYAPLPDGTLMAALMLVDGDASKPAGWPVAYPAAGQTEVPLDMGNEIPNPVPAGGIGGYPITLQFPPFDKLTAVTAALADDANKAVPIYLSTPESPATSFGQYGVVSAIPKLPLHPGAKYTATVTATWGAAAAHTWTWSFTTVGLRKVDASDEAALLAAIGHPSRVSGTVLYGGMMDTATAFLQIAKSDHGHYKMVSILIPAAVFAELAGKAKPETLRGVAVTVDATPMLVANEYLNLPIVQASQLQLHIAH